MAVHELVVQVSLEVEDCPRVVPFAVRVEEGIHELRKMVVTVPRGMLGLAAASLLRKVARVDVRIGDEQVRRFEGIVLGVKENWLTPEPCVVLTVGSQLDLLGLSTDCRIFQDLTMPEIVQTVLEESGIAPERIVKRLTGTYPKLESCTQYRETMLAFVTRLLGEDGAFYFIEDSDTGPKIVLGDSVDAHPRMQPAKLPFVGDTGLLRKPAVQSLRPFGRLRPSKVTLRDLDWKKPDLDLDADRSDKSGARSRELYEHPGGHTTPATGKKRAEVRLEALAASASGVSGMATAPWLSPGKTFELQDGPLADVATEWLVVQVTHDFTAHASPTEAWKCSFRALAKGVPFRPLSTTPKPRIMGAETAFVTGPSGQEIHTDEFGRVRLKFHWDRRAKHDEKSSPWVRVAQLQMSGAVAIPRVGWEVLVAFEHGDPDRPIVLGRLYNGRHPPPYELPAQKTVSTLLSYSSPNGEGQNEIRFDDAAGSELVSIHAQRDLATTVFGKRETQVSTNRVVTIKKDEAITVKGTQSRAVKGLWDVAVGENQTLQVAGKRTETVAKDAQVVVHGNRETTIEGAHTISTRNLTLDASGDVTNTVTGSLIEESTGSATNISVGDDLLVKVGGTKTEAVTAGKTLTTAGNRSVTIGGAGTNVSGKNVSVQVGGTRASTVGGAWNVDADGDIQFSGDVVEIDVGAALTMAGAKGISFRVGPSKVIVGQGTISIEANKVKLESGTVAALRAALVQVK
ncbi:MAG TPA: type VI secretion system tip protein TssI/VgrG [Labilithrix sp.]|nr:type VI secretion system tip protein TssI/VgrG [Labilithrix sp.]